MGGLRCISLSLGGYSCNFFGANTVGGPDCYSSYMYVYNISAAAWSVMQPPAAASDPQRALWPSARAFHSSTLVDGKLWIFGGAYVDQSGSTFYYNDMFVFNTFTLLWSLPTCSLTLLQHFTHHLRSGCVGRL
jgi:hypothetical protein